MLTDLLLAIAHHLLVFSLLGVLVAEMVILRPDMSRTAMLRVGRIDSLYGVIAGLVLVIGFCRVFFGIKGSAYYLPNPWFWAKIVCFAIVGLLSVPPTLRMIGWRRKAEGDQAFLPPVAEVRNVKFFMHLEAIVFILIPVFAAMMARWVPV